MLGFLMKKCSKCKKIKNKNMFYKKTSNKDGLRYQCKECVNKVNSLYRKTNPEKVKAFRDAWNNSDKGKTIRNKWDKDNPGKRNALTAKRRATKKKATPKWLTSFDFDYIRNIYCQARFLNKEVDHIVPLQGKNICGLHVPWNLQLLTKEENARKGNR